MLPIRKLQRRQPNMEKQLRMQRLCQWRLLQLIQCRLPRRRRSKELQNQWGFLHEAELSRNLASLHKTQSESLALGALRLSDLGA